MDVDPYLPVQQANTLTLAFGVFCFVTLIIIDAWITYKKKRKESED